MGGEVANITFIRVDGAPGLLLWADDEEQIPRHLRSAFSLGSWRRQVKLIQPGAKGRLRRVGTDGWWLYASRAAAVLAGIPLSELGRFSSSVAVWSLASKWVTEAVARQQLVPALRPTSEPNTWQASWRVAPVRPDDRARITGLASAMPGVARAVPVGDGNEVMTAAATLYEFMDAAADGLMRAPTE